MPNDPDVHGGEADDFEYDMAHEATSGPAVPVGPPTPQRPPTRNFGLDGGDYGYDMAHDVR